MLLGSLEYVGKTFHWEQCFSWELRTGKPFSQGRGEGGTIQRCQPDITGRKCSMTQFVLGENPVWKSTALQLGMSRKLCGASHDSCIKCPNSFSDLLWSQVNLHSSVTLVIRIYVCRIREKNKTITLKNHQLLYTFFPILQCKVILETVLSFSYFFTEESQKLEISAIQWPYLELLRVQSLQIVNYFKLCTCFFFF